MREEANKIYKEYLNLKLGELNSLLEGMDNLFPDSAEDCVQKINLVLGAVEPTQVPSELYNEGSTTPRGSGSTTPRGSGSTTPRGLSMSKVVNEIRLRSHPDKITSFRPPVSATDQEINDKEGAITELCKKLIAKGSVLKGWHQRLCSGDDTVKNAVKAEISRCSRVFEQQRAREEAERRAREEAERRAREEAERIAREEEDLAQKEAEKATKARARDSKREKTQKERPVASMLDGMLGTEGFTGLSEATLPGRGEAYKKAANTMGYASKVAGSIGSMASGSASHAFNKVTSVGSSFAKGSEATAPEDDSPDAPRRSASSSFSSFAEAAKATAGKAKDVADKASSWASWTGGATEHEESTGRGR